MRILARTRKQPFNVAPGDVVSLRMNTELDGAVIESKGVVRHEMTEAHTFDEGVIFELEDDELKEQGLTYAIGGWFGTRKRKPWKPSARDLAAEHKPGAVADGSGEGGGVSHDPSTGHVLFEPSLLGPGDVELRAQLGYVWTFDVDGQKVSATVGRSWCLLKPRLVVVEFADHRTEP